jgi:hypothetical protein
VRTQHRAAVALCAAALTLTLTACGPKFDGHSKQQPAASTAATSAPPPVSGSTSPSATPAASAAATPAAAVKAVEFSFKAVVRTGPGFRSGVGVVSDEYAAGEYAKDAFKALDAFWSAAFSNAGYTWGLPAQWRIARNNLTYASNCTGGEVTSSSPIFYCPQDGDSQVHGIVYLPSQTYWTVMHAQPTPVLRNFIGAMVAAYVFAHHVTHMLALKLELPSLGDGDSRLFAACLTGIWVQSTYPPDEFKPVNGVDPLNASITAFYAAVGTRHDVLPIEADVKAAFDTGLVSMSVAMCGNDHWPGSTWQ